MGDVVAFRPAPGNPRQPHTHGWRCGGKDMAVGGGGETWPERSLGERPGGEGGGVGTGGATSPLAFRRRARHRRVRPSAPR